MYMTFEGKEKMFTNVFEALRPGAKAVFIDFCGPSGDETEEFKVNESENKFSILCSIWNLNLACKEGSFSYALKLF